MRSSPSRPRSRRVCCWRASRARTRHRSCLPPPPPAFALAQLEKRVYQSLLELSQLASDVNDPQLGDYLDGFLKEQVRRRAQCATPPWPLCAGSSCDPRRWKASTRSPSTSRSSSVSALRASACTPSTKSWSTDSPVANGSGTRWRAGRGLTLRGCCIGDSPKYATLVVLRAHITLRFTFCFSLDHVTPHVPKSEEV